MSNEPIKSAARPAQARVKPSEAPAPSRRPGRLRLLVNRMPLIFFAVRLPVPKRWLRLTHMGRKSGHAYRTVLEVLGGTPEGEYLVGALWGRTDWLRNLEAGGEAAVVVGRQRFAAAHRVLSVPDADHFIRAYRAAHPRWSALAERGVGRPVDARNTAIIAFRPARPDAE